MFYFSIVVIGILSAAWAAPMESRYPGQVPTPCRSLCVRTCINPFPSCPYDVCVPGYECREGYVLDEGREQPCCVPLEHCRYNEEAEITDNCPVQGQVFQQCAPPYDLTCGDDPNTPMPLICTQRCACPPDAPFVDTKHNRCVKRYMCPRNSVHQQEELSHELISTSTGHTCPIDGQTFQICKPCLVTCENFGELIPCPLICEPGCGCPSGTVLDERNQRCVEPTACPRTVDCSLVDCQPIACLNPTPANPDIGECCPTCPPSGDVCALPPVTGLCKAYFPRFYYNSKTKECEEFIYGGCGGNGNNFKTKEVCENYCARITQMSRELMSTSIDLKCIVPPEDMRCYSPPNRWIYNINKWSCEQSTRKACQFDNTFETQYECLQTCSR